MCHSFCDGDKVVAWCHVYVDSVPRVFVGHLRECMQSWWKQMNSISRFPSLGSQSMNPWIPTSMNSFIYQSINPAMCFMMNINADQTTRVVNSICLFCCLFIYLFFFLSFYLSIYLSIYAIYLILSYLIYLFIFCPSTYFCFCIGPWIHPSIVF